MMTSLFDSRRYLTNFDSARTGNMFTDVLVIGSGVAGARAAIEAAERGPVILVAKAGFEESATQYAQGGIAAALAPDDSPQRHFDDTIRAGSRLNDPGAVRALVNEGPDCIRELMDWGLTLDQGSKGLALTREGGHTLNRIVHAHGDQSGKELVRTLRRRVSETGNIRLFLGCYLIDLITLDGICRGAVTYHADHGHQLIWAKQTILATGGCGQLWRETTNPPTCTGDGFAAAFRAGVRLRDMEMMQFHPTTLYVAGAGRALISEAVRGEGGILVDRLGNRFMPDYHPDAELAPRDVVSRAIHDHIQKTHANCVYLDVRRVRDFRNRFPQIARLCADFEIDVDRANIPVRPSAHYMVGGVEVGLDGRTGIEGLLCCGEVASTGVHGANRMASNSLLEGIVFGKRAGQTAKAYCADSPGPAPVLKVVNENAPSARTQLDLPDIRNSLRSVMWRNVGIIRGADRLQETCEILDFWAHYTLDKTFDDTLGWETQNKLTVARLVAMSALERTESLGVHFRGDAPDQPEDGLYHVRVSREPGEIRVERLPHQSN